MDNKLKGPETYKNLLATFAGEARARDKYDLYGEKANAEGLVYVGDVFRETAHNEYAHAREVFDRFLGKIQNTEGNLMDSARGEAKEANSIYKEYERTARAEGFNDIADFYKELAEVEETHEERFMEIYNRLKSGTLYNRNVESLWQCTNCGYIYEGLQVPELCPLCHFPKGFFAPYCNNNEKK